MEEEETNYLLEIPLEDGCLFVMDSPNDKEGKWEMTFPGGFEIKCPHGLTFNTDEYPTFE